MLARWWERLSHDRRVLLMALVAGAPGMAAAMLLLWLGDFAARVQWTLTTLLVGAWTVLTLALRDRIVRPLQTLANMLAALREGDFSIRARVRVHDAKDPLSLAYLEVNQLEEILREQRLGAVEATELLRKVLEEVDLAIFAFDERGQLRLVNRAGERLLELIAIGREREVRARAHGHRDARLELRGAAHERGQVHRRERG